MPDWSYQTVFRPVLFRLSPRGARDLALGCMGALSRLPLGSAVIDFMGHMRPDPRLGHTVAGITFPARVGLGACVDPHLVATRALSRFGIGFLEIGPLTLDATRGGRIERHDATESLIFQPPRDSPDLDTVLRQLDGLPDIPVLVRLACGEDVGRFEVAATAIIDRLGMRPSGFILELDDPTGCVEPIRRLAARARTHGRRLVLVAVSPGTPDAMAATITLLIENRTIDGVYLDGRTRDVEGRVHVGRPTFGATLDAVRWWRETLPRNTAIGTGAEAGSIRHAPPVLITAGGIHEPLQGVELIEAGSDLVSIDSGLIFSGPGLVKRVNEALLFRQPDQPEAAIRPEKLSWFWTCLIAVGMFFGGVLALFIAFTRVVMPYDEAMCGLTRGEILQINQHLLHFMAHDRVTLAGTMLAVGILYFLLSVFGSRRGMHWARRAIIVSASSGFASFFLFLGFGYFDPFHAFVTAVLFQLLVLAIHCDLPRYRALIEPDMINDRAWHLSQWGQLLFIIHGAVLVVAGCVIATVGITTVFVPEDLEFMQTSSEHLFGAHPRLVPLIAHDRATFGGMLIACGVCVLLSSLWGFRRGHAWLWWALVGAGVSAYAATISVHWHVGYDSLKHLLPAYLGLAMVVVAGMLSRAHLCGGRPA